MSAAEPALVPLDILTRLLAMAFEPFFVRAEIVLGGVGELLGSCDRPPRRHDSRVDDTDDVETIRHKQYSPSLPNPREQAPEGRNAKDAPQRDAAGLSGHASAPESKREGFKKR